MPRPVRDSRSFGRVRLAGGTALRTEGLYVSGQDCVYGVGMKPDQWAALKTGS
jgi:hypothetical protein